MNRRIGALALGPNPRRIGQVTRVVEILKAGSTQPLVCSVEGETQQWLVKLACPIGFGSPDYASLAAEVSVASLYNMLEIPVPSFGVTTIPATIEDKWFTPDNDRCRTALENSAGKMAFCSSYLFPAFDFTHKEGLRHLEAIRHIALRVFAADAFVGHCDRKAEPETNPNLLLWNRSLVAIDNADALPTIRERTTTNPLDSTQFLEQAHEHPLYGIVKRAVKTGEAFQDFVDRINRLTIDDMKKVSMAWPDELCSHESAGFRAKMLSFLVKRKANVDSIIGELTSRVREP